MEGFFQALSLDISILEALLKRNYNNHGRTIYFQRCSMVLQSIRRYKLLNVEIDWQALHNQVVDYSHMQQRRKKNGSSTDYQWDVQHNDSAPAVKAKNGLQQAYCTLRDQFQVHFLEIISRIEHASKPLFLEVSRGFFLPFCTVVIAALARIRTCLLRIGRIALPRMYEMATEKGFEFLSLPKDSFDASMAHYLEASRVENPPVEGSNEERRKLLATLGFASTNSDQDIPPILLEGTNPLSNLDETNESMNSQQEKEIDHNDEEIVNEDTGTETTAANNTSVRNNPVEFDKDDVGEALTSEHEAAPSSFNTDELGSDSKDRKKIMLSRLKGKDKGGNKATATESKKATKRKDGGSSSSAEKKKKKKAKVKGDFFDELFG